MKKGEAKWHQAIFGLRGAVAQRTLEQMTCWVQFYTILDGSVVKLNQCHPEYNDNLAFSEHIVDILNIFWGKISPFESPWDALKASIRPNMYWYWYTLPPRYVWGSFWACQCIIWGNWTFLLVRTLFWAFLRLSLWMLQNGIFWASPDLCAIYNS